MSGSIERWITDIGKEYRALEYSGPALRVEAPPRRASFRWAYAAVPALVIAVLMGLPAEQEWPEQLRPLIRSSAVEGADRPSISWKLPARPVATLPSAPSRTSCFAERACDQQRG